DRQSAEGRWAVQNAIQGLVTVADNRREPQSDHADQQPTGHGSVRLRYRMILRPRLEYRQHTLERHGPDGRNNTEGDSGEEVEAGFEAESTLTVYGAHADDGSCDQRGRNRSAHHRQ